MGQIVHHRVCQHVILRGPDTEGFRLISLQSPATRPGAIVQRFATWASKPHRNACLLFLLLRCISLRAGLGVLPVKKRFGCVLNPLRTLDDFNRIDGICSSIRSIKQRGICPGRGWKR
jgi:hypothetical protein